ncbi:MAG: transglutaminase domain-containing protein [Dehalococcoidia bacterium]|nr:transglutaminase domain-containing protein [Dehalococcoidia bacterium]
MSIKDAGAGRKMSCGREEYLMPTGLCDFDRCPDIRARAEEITSGCRRPGQKFQRLFFAVKELPYGLEDWDVRASETLRKGWGMCSGKTNLLVAMLRSIGVPARYRISRIIAEAGLWGRVTMDRELLERMGPAPVQQDHVDCEVWLEDWKQCDPSRDTPLERGLLALGIPLERVTVPHAPYLYLASFDEWARERQNRRAFRENRETTFARANRQLRDIRALARKPDG